MTTPADTTDDPGHWQAAMALVERLLELPEAQRAQALADEDAPEAVRRLAGRLLAAAGRDSILDAPLPAPPVPGSPSGHLAGRRLGRWLLVDLLGEGGMSVVYRARSLQAPVGQPAAVKLLSMAAATEAGRARFEREIDILVRLRHPGIAPVLDAGVADDGTPWFAMSLVEGIDIATWCREQGLGVSQRVELLLQVCDAVAHAHRHLVIHRDIKPSNVMVDAEGRAILLDFGISRILAEGAAEITSTGLYAFTPRYAAPEQLDGGAITTATDIYSLGSLLHMLLLGSAPQFPPSAPDAECVDPATIARREEDRELRKALAGDLGAILRKSLARDARLRYQGAAELAADLRAWREGLAVTARHGGEWYRLRRFVSRHRLPVALAAALALALVLGLGVSLWQRQQALAHAARAEATQRFLLELFAEANVETHGERPPDIQRVLRLAAEGVDTSFARATEQQAEVLHLIGQLQFLNADHDGALGTLGRALELDSARDAPWDERRRRAVLAHANALRRTGHPAHAAATIDDWLAEDRPRRGLSGPHCRGLPGAGYPDVQARRTALEAALGDCGALPAGSPDRLSFVARLTDTRRASGDAAAALQLGEAEDLATAALAVLPPGAWDDWVVLKSALAQAYRQAGRAEDAESAARAAVELSERHLARDNPFLVGPLRTHASILASLGRTGESRTALERAIALNDGGASPRLLHEAAALQLDLGSLLFREGDAAGAVQAYRGSLAAWERTGAPVPPFDQGITLSNLAAAHEALGQHAAAADHARRALALFGANFPAREDALILPGYHLCHALASLGDASGIEHCRQAMARERAANPDDRLLEAEGQQYLADAYARLRDWPQALAHADAALTMLAELTPRPGAADAVAARARFHRLEALAASGRRREAAEEWDALGDARCLAEPPAARARAAWRRASGDAACPQADATG